jgi:hypothetical protein
MNELQATADQLQELTVGDVKSQVQKIQQLIKVLMKPGEHFGIIPGAKKPSLYKTGAEKICFIFRLAPEYEITREDLPGGHREYQVICKMRQISTWAIVGEGVGACSTMESKYRYRNEETKEEVGTVPKEYWNTPSDDPKAREAVLARKFGPGKYRAKKTDDVWKVYRVTGDGGRKENPDLADVYNTVLKMAKKRAFIDATLTATAASDFFTQDIEDLDESPEPIKINAAQQPQQAHQAKGEAIDVSTGEPVDQPSQQVKDPEIGADALRKALRIPTQKYIEICTANGLTTVAEPDGSFSYDKATCRFEEVSKTLLKEAWISLKEYAERQTTPAAAKKEITALDNSESRDDPIKVAALIEKVRTATKEA